MEKDRQKYLDESKKRLLTSINQKIMTAAIGSLNRFEEGFGELLGINSDKLTGEQLKWRNEWEQVRSKILDLANDQKRLIERELNCYTIDWESVTFDIKIRPRS